VAVGADPRRILGMVVKEGMVPVLAAVAAGGALAVVVARLVRHLLYGSSVPDAVFLAAAGLLVAGVGLLACCIPARRAASIEPTVALRCE
jgi:putative ABC transport system permease protein